MSRTKINGFSRWSKEDKLEWVARNFTKDAESAEAIIRQFQYSPQLQELLDTFSENTISNFPMPYGVAPHFLINGKEYCVPMVIEESSVVAAASAAAKYWKSKGGFHAEVVGTKKVGQLHFTWTGSKEWLEKEMPEFQEFLFEETAHLTESMAKRGGGLLSMQLEHLPEVNNSTYQLKLFFDTCDSMGANFINSVLEETEGLLSDYVNRRKQGEDSIEVLMAILSNYTPECVVRAEVRCRLSELNGCPSDMTAEEFAKRFAHAVAIAKEDVYRATTHNKGIYNGVDAVVLATGNDFRAVEAAGHAYAARDGKYRSLSNCEVKNDYFHFSLEIPLALGTVGGLTKLHPMAALSHTILSEPSATELMEIIAAVGLAQNFSALRSLVTVGIQKGHMKMHLNNILAHFKASEKERREAIQFFQDKIVSFRSVRLFIENLRLATATTQEKGSSQ